MESSETTATPATTSECPPRNLVAEWMLTWNPRSKGRCNSGVWKVLSVQAWIPFSLAKAAMAARSQIRKSGLEGDSTRIARVLSVMAAFTASRSAASTQVVLRPQREKSRLKVR